MQWEVEYTDEFGDWWEGLEDGVQDSITVCVGLLEQMGMSLGSPYSSKIKSSKYSHMRELKVQHAGEPYRILYAFDPRRTAMLLIGGNKGGDDRWYETYVPIADKIYEQHLKEIE